MAHFKTAHVSTKGEVIAIDGKTVRGSFDKQSNAANNGVVLGQIKTEEK